MIRAGLLSIGVWLGISAVAAEPSVGSEIWGVLREIPRTGVVKEQVLDATTEEAVLAAISRVESSEIIGPWWLVLDDDSMEVPLLLGLDITQGMDGFLQAEYLWCAGGIQVVPHVEFECKEGQCCFPRQVSFTSSRVLVYNRQTGDVSGVILSGSWSGTIFWQEKN